MSGGPPDDPEEINRITTVFNDPDFDEIINRCADIMAAKGHDYTGGNQDRLHNFRTAAEATGTTPEQAWAVYWHKHVCAIMAFAAHGKVESEPIEGRICDAINYLLLLAKMVK